MTSFYKPRRRHTGSAAFTLVEVMVAAGLGSLVMAGVIIKVTGPDGQTTTVEVPPGSHVKGDPEGGLHVTVPPKADPKGGPDVTVPSKQDAAVSAVTEPSALAFDGTSTNVSAPGGYIAAASGANTRSTPAPRAAATSASSVRG